MDRRALLRVALGVPVAGVSFTLLGGLPDPALAQELAEARAPRAKPRPARLVMLDPGHGGKDPGAIGARGTHEKDVTLDIAKEVARLLDRGRGTKAALTRETDVFLSLPQRVQAAREARADLFISIHADSAPNANARGLSAYTLSENASDEFAAALAKTENLADGADMSHVNNAVAAILGDLAAQHVHRASLLAKHSLVSGVEKDLRLLENPKRSANFAVLKSPETPSVLVETGFLSNREDEKLLRDPAARRRIAAVLARELAAVLNAAPFA